METILPIAIGPALSVVFFFVTYRRTVGARKERARAGEDDLRRTLLRRTIVDGFMPSRAAVARLLEAKAREKKAKRQPEVRCPRVGAASS